MSFVVVRHPDAGIGTIPTAALEMHRARGWARVSEERREPSEFHLPDYTDAPDLDAEDREELASPAREGE